MKKLLLFFAAMSLYGQTAINDTLYLNSATAWTGEITVSWPAFTHGSTAVAKGSRTVAVNSGVVAVTLWDSETAAPSFLYTAQFRATSGPTKGTQWSETWSVPASPSVVTLATVRRSSTFTVAQSQVVGLTEALASAGRVASVAGRTGAVVLAKGDVGLGAVDNTADADKPVSGPQATALGAKAPVNNPAFTGTVSIGTPLPAAGSPANIVNAAGGFYENGTKVGGSNPTGLVDIACSGNIGTALNSAVAALDAANGGKIRLSAGSCYSLLQLSRTASTSLTIEGQGSGHDGQGIAPVGGTQLDLRYAAGPKISTTATGRLALRHLSLLDTTDGTQPFLYSTWTSIDAYDVEFFGKTSTSPTQNAIQLGGATASGPSASPDGFQGYGTVVQNCYFGNVNNALYARKFTNGITFINNIIWAVTGATSRIIWDGNDTYNFGVNISGNTIEVHDAPYGIKITNGQRGYFRNDFYDPITGVVSFYWLGANAINNVFISGEGGGYPFITGAGVNANLILDALGTATNLPAATAIQGTLGTKAINAAGQVTLSGAGSGLTIPQGEVLKVASKYGMYSDGTSLFFRANNLDNFSIDASGRMAVTNGVTSYFSGDIYLNGAGGKGLEFGGGKGMHIKTQAAGNDISGTCTFSGTTCTVTFTTGYNSAPSCTANDQTAAAPIRVAPTTGTLVLTGGTGAGATDVIAYHCIGNPN